MTDLPPMLTVRQAAAFLQCSRKTLHRLMASGELPYVKLGTGKSAPIRISRDVLMRYAGLESGRGQRRRNQEVEAEYFSALAACRGVR